MFFSYAVFKKREDAERYAEDMFACGTLTAYEFGGIVYRNGRYHLLVRG